MLSLVLSTVAFFVASHYARRHLDGMGMPKGATRSIWIVCVATAISFLVAFVVDWMGL